MKIFEHLYRSTHQLFYDDLNSDNLFEHIYLCFKDPECLREMANSFKKTTQLPMNIWVDLGKSYKKSGHWKRVKFQKDYGDRINKDNLGSIDLDGNFVKNTLSGCDIDQKDLLKLKNFVLNNKVVLDLLCDEILDFTSFKELIITGGDTATPQEIEQQHKELEKILNEI
jgi:hypothetical protein